MNATSRRLSCTLALALLSSTAAAGPLPLGQRELSGRDNRFIEIPQGHANAGFRAVSPGKRIAFDEGGVQMNLKSPRLEKGTNGAAALRYSFEGGARVAPKGVNASPTVYHWFVGERSQWLTNLKSYGAIAYRGVWPGVDAVFAGDAGGFKYQFELAAGAKPGTVALVVEGADSVRVNGAGALEWTIGGEKVIDDAPLAFQPSGTGFATVAAAYEVRPLGNGRWRIGFAIGDHDASKALIIDPAWTGYSGLVGGSANDQVYAVARDALANTYACGVTASTNMPSIPPGTVNAGGDDAFFVKFDSAGVAQIVAYVGGSGNDICNGIALDGSGRVYLAGGTTSTNFPAVGTDGTSRFRRTKASDRDAFALRFAAGGASIEYSGFIGGSEDDQANAIAVDSSNRAYVTGFSTCTAVTTPDCVTAGTAFPAFGGPRTTHGGDTLLTGGMDAFVARIDASGGTLEYAGFIGGDGGTEMGNAIAVGTDFSAYVAGATDSETGLASPGGFRTTINTRPADASDGFVAKVAPTGASLTWFTLLTGSAPSAGESGADRALAIALESDGTILVAGETDSLDFPADNAGARAGSGPQVASGGGMDGFVLRLNAGATAIDAATYLGGPGHDSAEGVGSDGTSLFVTGTTSNGTGFPTVLQSGLTTTPPGGQDGFLAKIARGAPAAFVYSGFLGTGATETLRAIAVSGTNSSMSVGGATTTAGTTGLTNPTTGALGASGAVNGLVLRIDPYGAPASLAVQSGSPQSTARNTAFATALSVRVLDADMLPVPGVSVTFTPPASGASATLVPATPVVTDASGIASVSATANGTAGSYTVSADAGALNTTFSLTNLKTDQAIAFASLADRTMLETPFMVSATASSGLVVTFDTSTPAICSVSGTTVTLLSAGTCTVAADQSGDADYNAAPQVAQSFQVTQVAQTISFAALPGRTLGDAPFAVGASASSGLAVSFGSLTLPVCTVSGDTVTLVATGTCTIAADQAGNAVYAAAAQVTQSFTVAPAIFQLTVSLAGAGSGTVTSSPAGIACGATCAADFAVGAIVTLSTVAVSDSVFAGWSGACTGTGVCMVTMDAAKSVTAAFRLHTVRGDANGDRRADLYWRESPASTGVSWWTMNGASIIGGNYFGVPGEWVIAQVGDLDGDGKSDLVWRNTVTGLYYLWRLDGLTPVGFDNLGIPVGSWTLAGTGDFDGDGKSDFVWKGADGAVYVWLMNGGAIASQGSFGNPGTEWAIAGVADMNADGKDDLVFRNTTTGQVFVWFMDGLSVASAASPGGLDPALWTLRAVADFSGDRKGDFLWQSSTGETWVWLMDGASFISAASIGTPGAGFAVRAVGDLDGDGKADIVWRDAGGATVYWRMDGASVASSAPIGNPGGTWQIVAP